MSMIIDLILNRKDGMTYSPKKFYDDVMGYYETWPKIAGPIAEALDSGEEADVKAALCRYIKEQDYNPSICVYINSVKWL